MVCRLIILQDTYLRIIMDYNLMLTLSGEETLQVILSLCILFSFLSIMCPQMNILYIGVYYSNIFIVIFYLCSVLCLQSPGAIQWPHSAQRAEMYLPCGELCFHSNKNQFSQYSRKEKHLLSLQKSAVKLKWLSFVVQQSKLEILKRCLKKLMVLVYCYHDQFL